MEQTIADADFIVALVNSEDSNHDRAKSLAQDLSARAIQVILNNITLYEILTVLSLKGFKQKALALYSLAQTGEMFVLVYATVMTEKNAYRYFQSALSKNISFADCLLLATADEHRVSGIISFDKHMRIKKDIPIIDGIGGA